MKRVLALALVGGALLLGGCDRSPASTPPPAGNHATPAASPPDVDSLLSDVDKQLSSDDQTPADQD